jgi:hypothetical protein
VLGRSADPALRSAIVVKSAPGGKHGDIIKFTRTDTGVAVTMVANLCGVSF